MSILFKPMNLGNVEIKNRFVHSATSECMATETGEISPQLVNRYRNIARGEVGLIIPGFMYVHPSGRSYKYQTGIHNDDMINGLRKLVEAVHEEDSKIIFQIAHAGRQTRKSVIGQTPISPSSRGRDPVYFVKPKEMNLKDIQEAVKAFAIAAGRAVEAGADGIQLHAAHGYLINQFLSPFFNTRKDEWGGSDINRFRFLKTVIEEVRRVIPEGTPLLVKMNTKDYTPEEGITPPLAGKYSGWLSDLKIDGIEMSCGSSVYAFMNMCRGDVPVKELLNSLSFMVRPFANLTLKKMIGKYDIEEAYNLEAAKLLKPILGKVPLLLVGGLRRVKQMEEILNKQYADFISMSRPFIREPFLVKNIREGKTEVAACASCNKCLAAVANNIPVYCYNKGFPLKHEYITSDKAIKVW
jgi:2,4-dienoyl-CoA reductase-like NADH-dependent reductase (Old Yellow Enzyme family)